MNPKAMSKEKSARSNPFLGSLPITIKRQKKTMAYSKVTARSTPLEPVAIRLAATRPDSTPENHDQEFTRYKASNVGNNIARIVAKLLDNPRNGWRSEEHTS